MNKIYQNLQKVMGGCTTRTDELLESVCYSLRLFLLHQTVQLQVGDLMAQLDSPDLPMYIPLRPDWIVCLLLLHPHLFKSSSSGNDGRLWFRLSSSPFYTFFYSIAPLELS